MSDIEHGRLWLGSAQHATCLTVARRGLATSLVLLVAGLLVGCTSGDRGKAELGSHGADSVDAAPLPKPNEGVDALILTVVGRTPSDLNDIVLRRRGEAVNKCMRASGFEPVSGEVVSPAMKQGGATLEKLFQQYEQEVQRKLPESSDSPPGGAERSNVVESCTQAAFDNISDPTFEFIMWVQEGTRDDSSRVFADPRVVRAKEAFGSCTSATGFAAGDEAELVNSITSILNPIIDSLVNGTVSRQDAANQVDAVYSKYRPALEKLQNCLDAYQAVVAIITAEFEQEFLDANSAAVDDWILKIRAIT
jgi:hypothetical protein